MPPISRRSAPPPPAAAASSSTHGYADASELDKYKFDCNIGSGSFGVISKVIRISDNKPFAMKQIDYGKMTDKDKKQILAEVAILESLKHRNIVALEQKIRDKQNERIYIVMEYCSSGDLGAIIRKAKRSRTAIPEDKIWNVFLQITLALNHCHWPDKRSPVQNERLGARLSGAGEEGAGGRCQVLHRDLKPENVFMSDEFVKLGDFGLSKDMGTASFTNTYVGTPLYMPPEILAENRYDKSSDIWSLGCMVFEMCVLSSPFSTATTQNELVVLVRSGRLPDIPSHYSSQLRSIIKAMLSIEPRKRPTTQQLLDMDVMRMHHNVLKMQCQAQLLAQRQDECASYEEGIRKRTAALDARERSIAKQEAALQARELECAAKEAELLETGQKMNVAAENIRAQWDHFMKERTEAEEAFRAAEARLAQTQAQVQAREEVLRLASMPTRPALIERATMPVASGSRPRAVPSLFEDTPTKIPLPSAAPLSLRKHASKSLGNLAAIARGDIGPSMPSSAAQPSFPGKMYDNPIEVDRTPAKQVLGGSSSIRSRKSRFGRNSIGSPGDLKEKYMYYSEDITMASAGNGRYYPSPSVDLAKAPMSGAGGVIGSGNGKAWDDSSIADNSAMASPFVLSKGPNGGRPRKSSLVGPGGISGFKQTTGTGGNGGTSQTPAEVLAQQRQQIQAPAPISAPAPAPAGASQPSATSSSSEHAAGQRFSSYSMAQATPAKWTADDPDLPSPFLRRMPTAPAVITTTTLPSRTESALGSEHGQTQPQLQARSQAIRSTRERERPVLGAIPLPNSTVTPASSSSNSTTLVGVDSVHKDITNGVSKLSMRPKGSAPPGTGTGTLGGIPRSKSGNLHQYAMNRAASEERSAKSVQAAAAAGGVGSMGYARSRNVARG